MGWNTGFVDVVHTTQGARLRTLLPENAEKIGKSSILDTSESVSCLGVIPRYNNPVGEQLGRSVVLAGKHSGKLSAWSLSSYDFDRETVPSRLHTHNLVDIIVWASPIKQDQFRSSSSLPLPKAGPPSTLVVTASENGEVKVWNVECVLGITSTAQLDSRSKPSMLRPTSTNRNMAVSTSSNAKLRSTTLRWSVRGLFKSKKSSQKQKLTSMCQLSITTIAIGFDTGIIERWRLPDVQVSSTYKIATVMKPIQRLKVHTKRVTSLASSALEEIAAASRGRRGY
jgi:WD40 repeat protein